jgi:hypothetical protein
MSLAHDDTPVAQTYMTREEAAAYLSERLRGTFNAKQISKWGDKGPRYRLFRGNKAARGGGWGRWALYTAEDLEAWIETQLVEPFPNGRPDEHSAGEAG